MRYNMHTMDIFEIKNKGKLVYNKKYYCRIDSTVIKKIFCLYSSFSWENN